MPGTVLLFESENNRSRRRSQRVGILIDALTIVRAGRRFRPGVVREKALKQITARRLRIGISGGAEVTAGSLGDEVSSSRCTPFDEAARHCGAVFVGCGVRKVGWLARTSAQICRVPRDCRCSSEAPWIAK